MDDLYDLVVIGAGPAGLSAAINGASELNRVLLIDSGRRTAPGVKIWERRVGGQATGSSRIENYAGFPDGISGLELTGFFERQAEKLGAHILCPEHAASLELQPDGTKRITTREGRVVHAKAVILASGLSYRKLEAKGVSELLGKGVLYGAPTTNPNTLGTCTVCVVGGANSAGQAVMHLSQNPNCTIRVLVRGSKPLEAQMSLYLVERIRRCSNVEVLLDVSVTAACGGDRLEAVQLRRGDGAESVLPTEHLFVFIGAQPKAEWLGDAVARDPKGFIAAAPDLGSMFGSRLPFETSMPGVFVAGDIRFGSVKRVAAAVGEGSAAIASVHRYLANLARTGQRSAA